MAIWSRYNLLVPRNDKGGYLFNTRTGALIGLSAERYVQITTASLLEDDFYTFLASQGFIIHDDIDELSLVMEVHEKERATAKFFSATIELTEACNFRCQYCYQSHTKHHLNDQVAERIIKYLFKIMRETPHLHVNWFGGEPLLRLKMLHTLSERLLAMADSLNCRMTQFITTNGYLLDNDVAHLLARLGIQNVQITLDGDELSHDQLRPLASGLGTYKRVIEACTNVIRAGIQLVVRVNMNRLNADKITGLLDDLLAVGVTPQNTIIHVVRTVNHGTCSPTMASACYTNAEFACEWIEVLRLTAERGFGIPTLEPLAYNCPFDLQQTVMIGYDGTIRHCSSSDAVLAEIDEVGNEIGRTVLFEKIKDRRPTDHEQCCSCKYLPMCMGGCFYLRELGQEACNPERYILGELVALTALQRNGVVQAMEVKNDN